MRLGCECYKHSTLNCCSELKVGLLTELISKHKIFLLIYYISTNYIQFATYSESDQCARLVWPTELRERWVGGALLPHRLSSSRLRFSELPGEISSKAFEGILPFR